MLTDVRLVVLSVASEHEVDPDAILKLVRHPIVVRARDHALALVKWSTGLGWSEIARQFGMDHTSVIAAVERHEALLNGEADKLREERRLVAIAKGRY